MNPKDIRTSSDPDLAGSYDAIHRATRSAQDLAIKTNTSILVSIDGKDVELTLQIQPQWHHPYAGLQWELNRSK